MWQLTKIKIGFLKIWREQEADMRKYREVYRKESKAKHFRSFLCCRRPTFLCPVSHAVAVCLPATCPACTSHGHEHMIKQGQSDIPHEIWYTDAENVFLFLLNLNKARELSFQPYGKPIHERNQLKSGKKPRFLMTPSESLKSAMIEASLAPEFPSYVN